MSQSYGLRLTPKARRALTERSPAGLPHAAAAAAAEFVTGALLENPQRVGKALRGQLGGRFSARRGDYRVLYTVDESSRTVTVVDIAHRRDAYRSF